MQNVTVMVQYVPPTLEVERAYSGSQMGRKAAFKDVLPKIDDDYLYRNEDIIFANLIKDAGFRYGKVAETSHDHQVMFKESRWLRRVKRASFELELSHEEEVRALRTYVCGIVKYLHPDRAEDLIHGVKEKLYRLGAVEGHGAERVRALGRAHKSSLVRDLPGRTGGGRCARCVDRAAAASLFASPRCLATLRPADGGIASATCRDIGSGHGPGRARGAGTSAGAAPGKVACRRVPAAIAPPVRLPTHEPLAQYRPTRIGRAAIYVLSGTDLALRGHIGPGRYLRRRAQAGSAPHRAWWRRAPTRAAMKLVKYVDQIASGRRSFRHVGNDLARRLAGIFQR